MSNVIERLRRSSLFLATALCFSAAGLLVTPADAAASSGERSCVCNNEEICAYQFQRFCCDFEGGSYQCGCTFWVTNCVDET